MTRVRLAIGGYVVYVYSEVGERHHLPHCHVRWGDRSASVALPDLEVLDGDVLPRLGRRLLVSRVDEIVAEWNRLNPGREVQISVE